MGIVTKTLSATAVGLGVAISGAAAWSAEVNWDLSNDYQASSIPGQADQIFADEVAKRSEGKVEVTLHLGGALGYKSVDVFDAVQSGAVQVGNASTVFWGGIHPIFKLTGMPFLISGPDEAKILYDAARPYYEQVLNDNNQILLYSAPWPPSGVWANKPIDTVEALDGLKIRTYDTNSTMALQALGASPVQLSWGDVVPQLAANAIEAVLTSAEGGVNTHFWEHLDHFTEINYAMPLSMATLNRDAFERLSDAQKNAVREAAAAAEEFAWSALADRTVANYETMRENGVTIVSELPPEMTATLVEGGVGVREAWYEEIGETGRAIVEEFNQKAAR